jgi:hypothetical protein
VIQDENDELSVEATPQGVQQNKNEQHRLELIWMFVDQVKESITNETFVSITLSGVKQGKKAKKPHDSDEDKKAISLRGSIRQIQGRLVRLSKGNRTKEGASLLLQLTLKYHLATDIVKNVKITEIRETITRLILDPAVASEWGVQAARFHPIQGALLETTEERWNLSLDGKPTLQNQKLKSRKIHIASRELSHDRVKQVLLSNQVAFLQRLGVTNMDGKPRPGMSSKVCIHRKDE